MKSTQEPKSEHPYTHPVDLVQVHNRVRSKIDQLNARRLRYRKAAKRYRNFSVSFRIAALVAVLFFALATYIFQQPESADNSGVSPESLALFFMLLAGLLVLTDQVITGTASWARKRLGELRTGDVAEDLEQKSITILLNVPDGQVPQGILEKIEDAISVAQTEIQTVEKEELDSWKAGVDAAWGALKNRIASDRDSIQAAYDAKKLAARTDENEANDKRGAVTLSFSRSSELKSAKLAIDGDESDWEPGTRSRAFAGVPAGHRAVTLAGTLKDGSHFRIEDVVLIKGGTKEDLQLTLP